MKKGSSMNSSKVNRIKTIFLGDSGSGKTSIVQKYVKGMFNQNNEATIGANFSTITKIVGETTNRLELWDTAGQERFRSIINVYYRSADVCIIVCDLNNPESIQSVRQWIHDIQTKKGNNENPIVIIVGNKLDIYLKNNQNYIDRSIYETQPTQTQTTNHKFRQLPTQLDPQSIVAPPELAKISAEYQYPLILTSAKEGTNINQLFETIFEKVHLKKSPPTEIRSFHVEEIDLRKTRPFYRRLFCW